MFEMDEQSSELPIHWNEYLVGPFGDYLSAGQHPVERIGEQMVDIRAPGGQPAQTHSWWLDQLVERGHHGKIDPDGEALAVAPGHEYGRSVLFPWKPIEHSIDVQNYPHLRRLPYQEVSIGLLQWTHLDLWKGDGRPGGRKLIQAGLLPSTRAGGPDRLPRPATPLQTSTFRVRSRVAARGQHKACPTREAPKVRSTTADARTRR